MLKFACGQNFVLFGHSGHELQRFENSVLVNLYGIVAAVIICLHCSGIFHTNMYSIVKTKSLKRCDSCLESKFSQQTNLSMKILILGSISAENEDRRSMKITLEIIRARLCYMLRNMQDSTYLIFVHHEGEPIQVFYSTKKM